MGEITETAGRFGPKQGSAFPRYQRADSAEICTLPSQERHEVRKSLKKLCYAVEFFQNLYSGKRLKQYLKRLEALQEDLGHLNDVATAQGLTERLKKENPKVNGDWRIGCGIVMGWHTQAAGILEPHLVEHWGCFVESKPFWH